MRLLFEGSAVFQFKKNAFIYAVYFTAALRNKRGLGDFLRTNIGNFSDPIMLTLTVHIGSRRRFESIK